MQQFQNFLKDWFSDVDNIVLALKSPRKAAQKLLKDKEVYGWGECLSCFYGIKHVHKEDMNGEGE